MNATLFGNNICTQVRILKGEDNPGLYKWVLNSMIGVLIRHTPGETEKRRRHYDQRIRDGGTWSQAQEHRQPQETGGGIDRMLP